MGEEISTPGITPVRKEKVQKAMALRMKALKQEMDTSETTPSSNAGERVLADINSLKNKVGGSSLSANIRTETLANLDSLSHDAVQYQSASGPQKQKLKQAMNLRFDALKKELSLPSSPSSSSGGVPVVDKQAAESKVQRDISALSAKIKASSLSLEEKSVARSNLEAISKDARSFAGAHGERASKLKKAMTMRLSALHKELAAGPQASVPTADKTRSSSKVRGDIKKLERMLRSSTLSSKEQRDATDNLEAMAKDADKLALSTNPGTRNKIARALEMREEALRQQLHASEAFQAPKHSVAQAKPIYADKVIRDVTAMKSKIAGMKMSRGLKREMEENLNAIEKDGKRYISASRSKKNDLSKAIDFRMKALRKEIAKAH